MRRGRRGRSGRPQRRLHHHRADLPARRAGPGPGLHHELVGAALGGVHPTPHVPARGGGGRLRADPRPRPRASPGVARRPHLRAPAPRRARVLGRHAGPGLGLRARGEAPADARVRGHVVLRRDRGHRPIPGRQAPAGGHLRHRDGRPDRRHPDPPHRARRHLLQRAGHDPGRAGARRHPVPQPQLGSATRGRRLQDHRVRAQPPLRPAPQPPLRAPRHSRHPGRAPGVHHHRDRQEPGAPGAGRDQRRPRLHAGRAAGRRQAGGAGALPRPLQGDPVGLHLLLLHEHAGAPVRRPEGARGGELRDRQACAGAAVRGRPRSRLLVHPAVGAGVRQGPRPRRLPVGRSHRAARPGAGAQPRSARPGRAERRSPSGATRTTRPTR